MRSLSLEPTCHAIGPRLTPRDRAAPATLGQKWNECMMQRTENLLLAAQGSAFVQQQRLDQGAEFLRLQKLGKGDIKKHPINHVRPLTEPAPANRVALTGSTSTGIPRGRNLSTAAPRKIQESRASGRSTAREHAAASHDGPIMTAREALVSRVGTRTQSVIGGTRLHSQASQQSANIARLETQGSSLSSLRKLRSRSQQLILATMLASPLRLPSTQRSTGQVDCTEQLDNLLEHESCRWGLACRAGHGNPRRIVRRTWT
jgi:hypothetical protein